MLKFADDIKTHRKICSYDNTGNFKDEFRLVS